MTKKYRGYNSKGLYIYEMYKIRFEVVFSVKAPRYDGKTGKLINLLIEEQGLEPTRKLLIYAVNNWNALCSKLKISANYPTINIIYGFRFSILENKNKLRSNSVFYVAGKETKKKRKNKSKEVFLNS